MALEPARVITKVRAPDFLFLHDKDFWFKQIWVDLHQTADLKPRQLGFFDYRWYEWDGKGKHDEEAFAGHTMGCTRLMVTDNNVEPFHYHNWRPIEYFAARDAVAKRYRPWPPGLGLTACRGSFFCSSAIWPRWPDH